MRSTVETLPAAQTTQGHFEPLTADEIRKMNAYWRACNYLSAGMLYLCHNPLLREPLKPEHIKNRLRGDWGSEPGQSFIWVHMNPNKALSRIRPPMTQQAILDVL